MKNKDFWGKKMIFSAIGVICFMSVTYLIIISCFTSMEQRGQFGDMFGMVNALFSGLAFAGVIITIRQQHIDLEYQRVTIKQTNDEMERQTKEFELQNKTLKRQQFDNTYFELLNMLQSIVDGLSLDVRYKDEDSTKTIKVTGRAVFQELFTPRYKKNLGGSPNYTEILKREIEEKGVDEILSRIEYKFLYHYFRFVYRVIKFVDETSLLNTTEERYEYILFLRSTLSNYETATLFYNCLTSVGKTKFKLLAERYALFDNIDEKLIATSIGLGSFAESAYSFYRGVVIENTRLRMRVVNGGKYQWQVDVNMIAKNDDVSIQSMELNNSEPFWEKDWQELKHLRLTKILINNDFDISLYDERDFESKGKDLYQLHWVDTHKISLRENDKACIKCADITYTIREMDGYAPMPSKGWSLKITEKGGATVSVPLKMEILGRKNDFFS